MAELKRLWAVLQEEQKCIINTFTKISASFSRSMEVYDTSSVENQYPQKKHLKKSMMELLDYAVDFNIELDRISQDFDMLLNKGEQTTLPEKLKAPPMSHSNPFLHAKSLEESELHIKETPTADTTITTTCSSTSTVVSTTATTSESPRLDTSNIPSILNPEAIPFKGSAVKKLKSTVVHDRYSEAVKRFDRKIVPEGFKLVSSKKPSEQRSPETIKKKSKSKSVKNPVENIPESFLKVGDECCFMTINTPADFYLQVVDTTSFKEFSDLLQAKYSNKNNFEITKNYKSVKEAEKLCGQFCCGFMDNHSLWVRVQILDWSDPRGILPCYLIDYGEKNAIDYTKLRPLVDDFALTPQMAIKCHMAMLLPPNGLTWTERSGAALRRLVGLDQKERFKICFLIKEGNSFGVDFHHDRLPKTLGEILVETKEALQEQLLTNAVPTMSEGDSDKIQFSDEDMEFHDNINEAIAGYDAQDEARICPFTRNSGRCYKGPKCKLDHETVSRDGITTDKVLTHLRAFNELELPERNTEITVLVTAYKTTCNFYVNIINQRVKSNLYNDCYQNLLDQMNHIKTVSTYQKFKIYPGVAELVLVNHGGDWLRGRCRGFNMDSQYEIFLVDVGDVVEKDLSDLRQMHEDFLHVPYQAVECKLQTCQQKSEVTAGQIDSFFMRAMHHKTFKAFVSNSSEPLIVSMWDSTNTDFACVLLNFSMVDLKDVENVEPSEDCPIQLKVHNPSLWIRLSRRHL